SRKISHVPLRTTAQRRTRLPTSLPPSLLLHLDENHEQIFQREGDRLQVLDRQPSRLEGRSDHGLGLSQLIYQQVESVAEEASLGQGRLDTGEAQRSKGLPACQLQHDTRPPPLL